MIAFSPSLGKIASRKHSPVTLAQALDGVDGLSPLSIKALGTLDSSMDSFSAKGANFTSSVDIFLQAGGSQRVQRGTFFPPRTMSITSLWKLRPVATVMILVSRQLTDRVLRSRPLFCLFLYFLVLRPWVLLKLCIISVYYGRPYCSRVSTFSASNEYDTHPD